MKKKDLRPILEAALQSGLSEELILRFVAFQWIIPADRDLILFDEEDLTRARLIRDLQEHFGVNDAAIPIILSLLDQLNRLRLERSSRDPR